MIVRDAVFDFLRRQGVDPIFGNPGSTETGMLRDWPSDLAYVPAPQESIAVAAAAGHATPVRHVLGTRVSSASSFTRELNTALAADGPYLLEIPVTAGA